MLSGNAPADRKPQAQAVGGRVQPLGKLVAVKYRLQPLRRDAAARVAQRQHHVLGIYAHLQAHKAAPGGEFERVGQQVQQQALQTGAVHLNHVAPFTAPEVHAQAQKLPRLLRPLYHLPAQAHDIAVGEARRAGRVQVHRVGQVVGQAQDAVVALAEQGRAAVRLRVRVPPVRGGQLVQGPVDVAQGRPQLTGDLLQNALQLPVPLVRIF